ncbi:MAG: Gfo/Idh/MocA family oxidoreductase [Planctomycetota bacterium]|nr:Gfo/Idh/MocA family oxidoreductase [Planctomycetota bacterium]
MNRRRFLKSAAAAAFTVHIIPRHVLGAEGQTAPSDKLNIAGVGVGGQGGGDLGDGAISSQNIVALCDVDANSAAGSVKRFPKAEVFKDYRVMLEKCKGIDAVLVATPDHMHAPVALAAMRAGKHVYVEKPMCHSVEEARVMTKVAKETGLVTQMGNQGHGGEGLRATREWIQAGAIGAIKEAHCWSDRPGKWWPQPVQRPTDTPPVRATLDWDLWLGGAPERPYHPCYLPAKWRGWFDFGNGAMGDMAVHNMDPAFYALDLDTPIATQAQTSEPQAESFPAWEIITYEFAAKGARPAVKVLWYDGGKKPVRPEEFDEGFNLGDNGIYFRGEKGVIFCEGWAGMPRLFPRALRKDFQPPPKTIPRSIGHRAEWVKACKERKPEDSKAGFAYSGPYVESLLIGNLASWLQKRVEWDAANMKASNAPEAEPFIRKKYRAGFGI